MFQEQPASDVVVNLHKPSGVSSNRALQMVKKHLGCKKAGFIGTLDPLAEGVLPLFFNQATKLISFLEDGDKRYRARFKVGLLTDTGDITGTVLATETCSSDVLSRIGQNIGAFQGDLLQCPPMYSAIKQNGIPLYKLARQGKTVDRKQRRITLHHLNYEAVSSDEFILTVHCSKGTYIRTLGEDLARSAGTIATMTALTRLSSGQFHIDASITLDAILQEPVTILQTAARFPAIMNIPEVLQSFEKLTLSSFDCQRLQNGQSVTFDRSLGVSDPESIILENSPTQPTLIISEDDRPVALAHVLRKSLDPNLKNVRMIKPIRVFNF